MPIRKSITSSLLEYPYVEIIQKLSIQSKIRIFLVGGFLRDYLLGFPKNDLDFTVDRDAVKFAKKFAAKIRGAFVLLDKERGCARVVKKKDNNIFTFDFSDFRAKTLRRDLILRDFTINTLYVDILKVKKDDNIADTINDANNGLKDINAKIIRMTSPRSFDDDPLRMMRAFSLRAVLGFKIEKETLKQIKSKSNSICDVSPERVRDELFKILASNRAAIIFKEMYRIGILENIIPQVKIMYSCKQKGTYHHLDVWPHSIETLLQLEKMIGNGFSEDINVYLNESLGGNRTRMSLLKLAAVLHDIGKPDAKKKINGKLKFHGHENIGKKIVSHIARMLKLSIRERHVLEDLVQLHLRPGYLSNFKQPSKKAVYRFMRDAKDETVSVALLALADQKATRGPLTTDSDQECQERICMGLINEYFRRKKEKPFVCLINGNDIKKKLKLKPAPIFSTILDKVTEQQVLGNITNKQEALLLAERIAEKHRKR